MQVCPVAAKMPEITPFTALSMSASSKTMFGDLPPSSMADALQAARRRFVDALPGGVRAGERDLGDERMLDQRRADFVRRSRSRR